MIYDFLFLPGILNREVVDTTVSVIFFSFSSFS